MRRYFVRAPRRISAIGTLLLCVLPSIALAGVPPAILFTDLDNGPVTGGPGNLGAPIAIFGTGFGKSQGNSKVTIGGKEVAAYLVWGSNNAKNPTLDMLEVQPGATVTGGSLVVTVDGMTSNSNFTFTPNRGQIRYVAPNGSDSANCSEATPCASIGHLIEPTQTNPGDLILVRGGITTENEIWVRKEYGHGGSAGQQKTIKAFPGEIVTFINGDRPFIVDADYVTVSGFSFANGKSLGVTEAGDVNRRRGDRLINNAVVGPVSWSFIDTHGDDHLVAGNVCDATSSSVGTQGHCYYVSYGNNIKLLYNIGSGAPGYGIHVFDQQRASVDFKRVIGNVLIEGNILKHSTERSGLILAMGDEGGLGNVIDGVIVRNNILTGNNHLGMTIGGNVRNIKIYNNTFFENGRQGLYISSGALLANIDVRNNLFFQTENSVCALFCSWYTTAHIQVDPAALNEVSIRNNGYFGVTPTLIGLTDPAAISGAVSFANPVIFDFHLKAGGAALDRGLTLGEVPTDYVGLRRPSGSAYELGAFETFSGIPQSMTPPGRVRVSR